MKPTPRDLLLLLGLQVGIGLLMGVVVALLPFGSGSGAWVAAVGAMIGAQSFVLFKERKQPGSFVPGFAHRLALGATAGQLVLAGVYAAFFVTPETVHDLGINVGVFLALVVGISAPLAYGLTRWGLRMGLSNVERMKKAADKARSEKRS